MSKIPRGWKKNLITKTEMTKTNQIGKGQEKRRRAWEISLSRLMALRVL
jgi:hypothetical protein